MSKIAIGIDLGMTNSRVAVYRHGSAEIIVNEQGSRATPSYVAFTGHLKLVGDAARRQAGTNPKNTIFGKWYTTIVNHEWIKSMNSWKKTKKNHQN